MLSRRIGIPIDLDKYEAGRIIGALNEIETRDAGLLYALAGVLNGGLLESLDGVGLDMYMDVRNDHNYSFI